MGRTAWEILTGQNKPTEVENQYPNPLQAKLGSVVTLDVLDYQNRFFHVREIWYWTRHVNDSVLEFTDYYLFAPPANSQPELRLLLRLCPKSEPDLVHKQTHDCLLLSSYYDGPWQQGLEEACEDPKGIFEVRVDDQPQAQYFRVGQSEGQDGPLPADHCEIVQITPGPDGKARLDGVVHARALYWDFARTTRDQEIDEDVTEYWLVEQDQTDKDYRIWTGREFNPKRLTISLM